MPTNSHAASQLKTPGANFGPTLGFIAGLLLLAGFLLMMSCAFTSVGDPTFPLSTESLLHPALQANPVADVQKMRAAEEAILTSYGWVDEEAEIVRIPVDRAIQLTAERGLPTREQ